MAESPDAELEGDPTGDTTTLGELPERKGPVLARVLLTDPAGLPRSVASIRVRDDE